MRRSERLAKAVVEAIIPGSRMMFRNSQANSEYDFDLWLHDGSKAALEVTASVDRDDLRAIVAITDPRKGGQFLAAQHCRYTWHLQPTPGARIDRIREQADQQLARLEVLDVREFGVHAKGIDHAVAAQVAAILRVDSAKTLPWIKPPQIIIGMPGRGGLVTYDSITTVLSDEALKPDNRKKLGLAAGTIDRHLFVVVDPTSQDAWGALLVGSQTPLREPELPSEITHGWIACQSSSTDPVRAMTYTRGTGWRDWGMLRLGV